MKIKILDICVTVIKFYMVNCTESSPTVWTQNHIIP